jgi:hypothetical protein
VPVAPRFYIIYDGRACGAQGTDGASVLFAVGEDRTEAVEAMAMYGQCALYSYAQAGRTLSGERWECDGTAEAIQQARRPC